MRNMLTEDAATQGNHETTILPVDNATLPYWRTEPHEIDEYRSTENLPSECDIAIIGAGMAGVATAYHLVQAFQGRELPSIVLLEARQVCSGATGRNGGHCKVKTDTAFGSIKRHGLEAASEIINQVREEPYALKEVVENEGLDCEFELRRSFDVFLDSKQAQDVAKTFRDSLKAGERWTRVVDLIDGEHVEQVTSLKNAKAAFNVPVCSFWPYKFVSQLLSRLVEKNHVNLQTNTPVTRLVKSNGVNLLHTPRGSLKAAKVVFATNGYTAGILPSYTSKIVPTMATATHISTPAPVHPHLSNTYNINYGPGVNGVEHVDYLNPRPNGSIVVGGGKWTYGSERDKWYNRWDDSVLLEEVRPHFEDLMQKHFKGWEESGAKLDMIWTGVIGTTSDQLPHIGEVPESDASQYVIAGFNGGGMAMIFSCARGLAKMLASGVSFEETNMPRLYQTTKDRLR